MDLGIIGKVAGGIVGGVVGGPAGAMVGSAVGGMIGDAVEDKGGEIGGQTAAASSQQDDFARLSLLLGDPNGISGHRDEITALIIQLLGGHGASGGQVAQGGAPDGLGELVSSALGNPQIQNWVLGAFSGSPTAEAA